MNTHETYVSLEVAKLLKQAGFDWETEFGQHIWDRDIRLEHNINFNSEKYLVSLPTLSVAQKWLREVKGYYTEIIALENKHAVKNSDGFTFHYEYGKPKFDCDIQNERCENISTLDHSFDTYEEAQDAGIKKCLTILLEQNKNNE